MDSSLGPEHSSSRLTVVCPLPIAQGLACSTVAARRGHDVTLFDAADGIGGQFNLAKQARATHAIRMPRIPRMPDMPDMRSLGFMHVHSAHLSPFPPAGAG